MKSSPNKTRLLKSFLLPLCTLACFTAAFSQTATPSFKADTIPYTHPTVHVEKPVITWKWALIPGTMIAYGATALNSDCFKDWNESVKEEIWTEKPHNLVHIDNYLQWAPATFTFALGFAGVKGKHNFTDRALLFGMAELIQSSVTFSIKKIGGETRPNGDGQLSFPSGHTSNAFTGAEFMRLEYKDVSPWYGVGGYVLAASTGFLRMYNNKHWLSDVVAGAGVGILSTDLAYYLYPKIKGMFSKRHPMNAIILPTYQSGTFGLAMVRRF